MIAVLNTRTHTAISDQSRTVAVADRYLGGHALSSVSDVENAQRLQWPGFRGCPTSS